MPQRLAAAYATAIGAIVIEPVLVLGDLGGWVVGVFQRIGDVSVYWLVLALALKTSESAFIGLAWRNILLAAYPKSGLRFKTAWAASQGGTAINALTPAQAGTAAMIGLFRSSIPGSSVAGVTSATVVPDPPAIRARREPSIIFGSVR